MRILPGVLLLIISFAGTVYLNENVSLTKQTTAEVSTIDTAGFVAAELSSMVKLRLITGKQAKKLAEILSPLEVEFINSAGKRSKGLLIVHKNVAATVKKIFSEMADSGFVIEKIEPMSKYDWSDEKSMNANNTSAFNYRLVSGTRSISKHANGLAIDINPLWNPFVSGKHVSPKGAIYDKKRPGTVHKGSPVYKIFRKHGWKWGGEWIPYQDYQHFFFDKIKTKSF